MTRDGNDDYDEWPVAELQSELAARGLNATGSRGVLIDRLRRRDLSEHCPLCGQSHDAPGPEGE